MNDADGFAQQVIFDLVHSQRCPSHSAAGGGVSARSMPQTLLLLQMISFFFCCGRLYFMEQPKER